MRRRAAIATASLVACAVLIGLAFLAARTLRRSMFGAEIARFESVQPGMSESQVRNLLGQPFREYHHSTAPNNYYVDGYSFERRAITGKVLIYIASEPIAYVYLDQMGIVEYVYVGGS